ENGAGKSTLVKILSGFEQPTSGEILLDGKPVKLPANGAAEALGIVIIHQELALVPMLSIKENIFLGNECTHRGVIDWNEATRRTQDLLAKVGLHESPNTLITDIGVGKQQLVEIAKALAKEVRLLILDEPTASLNESDSDALLQLLLQFKAQGISSILISHKLGEVSRVADSITILRDGATIETLDCRKDVITEDRIIRGMVGRDMTHRFPPREPHIGETIFEVKDWTVHHPAHADRIVVDNVSLHVRRGEVVGIAGLMGSGRTELAMSIFGHSYGRNISGTVSKHGQAIDISSIDRAIASGIAYGTEDRKTYGLVLIQDIKNNVTLANLGAVANGFVLNEPKEMVEAQNYQRQLSIKCSSILQKTVNLSGGNQQKVVLSKWLFAEPEILILDEPTRGIDVGAKYEIYTLINRMADEGKGVIVISSELPEILGICDRVYVMNKGKFVGELTRAEATQEAIMKCIMSQEVVEAWKL
ncbi:MAG: sugar ABC transporter ATP-binding protein, partial [Caldilineaceae bacterium]|nr:sugar ABC transporter ATP-binding protein [Caldilineaceae bacterium]